ncbi:MAG TPA: c-type cytochrome [Candidatus Binatus sp.]|nr:c-type cytochrome [Candidatus Binatus sp.]
MNAKRVAILSVVGLLAAFAFVMAGARAQSDATVHSTGPGQSQANAGGPKKAEEQFKNIQVLKGIPAEQLVPTMQFVAASLGVQCDFCHVPNAFEKDDKKPKQTARKMMAMMITINAENFDGHRAVTCNSCHRGNPIPQAIPPVMTEDPKEPMAMAGPKPPDAKETAGPAPEQLLDKYVQAAGGAAAIDKVTSRVMKGTIDFGGKTLPIDIYSKDPEKRISFTHLPEGDSVTAFNGREGWLASAGRPGVHEMHGSELDAASIDADLHLATHLKAMFSEMKAQGTERIGDHDAFVVVGQREGKPPVQLYFDQQSGLLVRLVRYGDTALGLLPTQIDYADYRDSNGVKIPFRWTLARPSGRFTIQVSDVKQNVPVDDAKFVKPPAEEPKAPEK